VKFFIIGAMLSAVSCGSQECDLRVKGSCIISNNLPVSAELVGLTMDVVGQEVFAEFGQWVNMETITYGLTIEFGTGGMSYISGENNIYVTYNSCSSYVVLSHELLHFLAYRLDLCSTDENLEHRCRNIFVDTAGANALEMRVAWSISNRMDRNLCM